MEAYEDCRRFRSNALRRTIRRNELRRIVPLPNRRSTKWSAAEFPRCFNVTPRCVIWVLDEVQAWIEAREQAPRDAAGLKPDVHLRSTRPVRAGSGRE